MDDVRQVRLEPMRYARFHAMGTSPEQAAWDKLKAWAEPRELWKDPARRLFGFDNPLPTPGRKEYGYEVWVSLPDGFVDDDSADIREFRGGDYAVLRVEVPKGLFETIGQGWMRLNHWVESNGYSHPRAECLEESIRTDRKDLEFILDLHHPIDIKA